MACTELFCLNIQHWSDPGRYLPENWKSVSSSTIGSTNSILFLRWWSRFTFLPDFLVGLSNFWKKAFLPLLASFARIFAFTFGLRPSMPNLGKDPWSRSTCSSSTSSLELSISSCSSWFLIKFLPLRNPPLFSIALGGLTVVVKPGERDHWNCEQKEKVNLTEWYGGTACDTC